MSSFAADAVTLPIDSTRVAAGFVVEDDRITIVRVGEAVILLRGA